MSTLAILLSSYILSVVALFFSIWSQRSGLFDKSTAGAEVIFAGGEIGTVGETSATVAERSQAQKAMAGERQGASTAGADLELQSRARTDASTAPLVCFFFFCCTFARLLVASAAGLTASIKTSSSSAAVR